MSSPFADRSEVDIEDGSQLAPKFDHQDLLPVIATDYETGEVLMLAYMNAEALARTIEIGEAVYYSRSRQELWHKGATSGHTQRVREIRVDCDQDAIWLRVEQAGGGACHTGHRSCFYRKVTVDDRLRLVTDPGERAFDPDTVYGPK